MADIIVTGVEELQAKLAPERFHAGMRRILTMGAIQGENLGKERSPVNLRRGGRLRASITHVVDQSSPPTWARYGTNVQYGLYLNSPVTRNPHYRSGPRAGQSTANWLTGTVPEVQAYVNRVAAAELLRAA